MPHDPQTTPVFQKHWIRTFGKIEGFLMQLFGKTIEMPSGNRITWWRGKAYVWERNRMQQNGKSTNDKEMVRR